MRKGSLDVVNKWIGAGAETNVPCSNGWAPIHLAYLKGHLEIVNSLIEAGEDTGRCGGLVSNKQIFGTDKIRIYYGESSRELGREGIKLAEPLFELKLTG